METSGVLQHPRCVRLAREVGVTDRRQSTPGPAILLVVSLTFDTLASHRGEAFHLAGVPVVLAAATPAGSGGSVIFEGPLDPPLAQDSYLLAHADLGEGVLFVVPIGQTPQGRTYEAIFG